MSEDKKPKIQEGLPIYIESLLSAQEFKQMSKLYPNTCNLTEVRGPNEFPKGDYYWRKDMGSNLNKDEVKMINKRIVLLEEHIKSLPNWNTTF